MYERKKKKCAKHCKQGRRHNYQTMMYKNQPYLRVLGFLLPPYHLDLLQQRHGLLLDHPKRLLQPLTLALDALELGAVGCEGLAQFLERFGRLLWAFCFFDATVFIIIISLVLLQYFWRTQKKKVIWLGSYSVFGFTLLERASERVWIDGLVRGVSVMQGRGILLQAAA